MTPFRTASRLILAAGIAAGFNAAGAPVRADTLTDFYKGKTLTIVIGFAPGGAYDLYAQLLSRHMPKFIPGKPSMIVQHMPGGGGVKGTNYIYNVAARDGSVLGMPFDAVALMNVLTPHKVKYKATEFQWIGSALQVAYALVLRTDTGIASFAELTKRQAIVGTSGKGSLGFVFPSMLGWATPAKIKLVLGYRGSSETLLAMERGEIQGTVLAWASLKTLKGDWFRKDGFARPIVQFGTKKEADLPDVPLAIDLATSTEAKAVAKAVGSVSLVGRSFVLPPKVSADKLAMMRTAFERMVRDPEFIAEAKARHGDLNPVSGAEVQEVVAEAMKLDPKLAIKARQAVLGEN